jgi:hypothetical protein
MSEIKVNKISPRTACGTTTLGDSGDTFTIPAGVSITNNGTASGFGATGSASWNTTVKTSGFTAVAGEGYFVDTTSGPITVNLPAGTAGAVVAFKDYANTFDSNGLTLNLNGSDKIAGSTTNPVLGDEGIAVTLVFVDSTKGWLVTDSGLQSEAEGALYISASGGTETTVCTNFKVHTFTGPGTFTVSSVGNSAGSNTVDYLVVAGGAGGGKAGGSKGGGGGGAGGYRESPGEASGCYAVSPLGAAPAVALPVSAQGYPIVVGAGGAQLVGTPPTPNVKGNPGNTSSFSTISSAGGGGGGSANCCHPFSPGIDGGSGGGGGYECTSSPHAGGSGNTPPANPAQGKDGGASSPGPRGSAFNRNAGGGGGATVVGTEGGACSPPAPPTMPTTQAGGPGGTGATSSINGTPTARAGGGGGGAGHPMSPAPMPGKNGGTGGSGGGGAGGLSDATSPYDRNGIAGTVNTGGGGGGGSGGSNPANPGPAPFGYGGAGGSGIVIIRYKFQ